MFRRLFLPAPRIIKLSTKQSLDYVVLALTSIVSASWARNLSSDRLVGRVTRAGFRIALYRPLRLPLFNPVYLGEFTMDGELLYMNGRFEFAIWDRCLYIALIIFSFCAVIVGIGPSGPHDIPETFVMGGRLIPLILLLGA